MFVSRSERELPCCSIQRDSCVTGANAMSASFDGQRRRVGGAAHERVARRARRSLPASTGFQRVAGATVGVERDLARPGAPLEERRHRSPPARRRHLALGRRSSSPARAFRLRRTSPATPRGPTPAPCRTSAARPASPAVAGRRRSAARSRQATAAPTHAQRRGDQELSAGVHGHRLRTGSEWGQSVSSDPDLPHWSSSRWQDLRTGRQAVPYLAGVTRPAKFRLTSWYTPGNSRLSRARFDDGIAMFRHALPGRGTGYSFRCNSTSGRSICVSRHELDGCRRRCSRHSRSPPRAVTRSRRKSASRPPTA